MHIPFGTGNLPARDVLATFVAAGYTGNAIVEESDGVHDGLVFLEKAAWFWTAAERGML